jgi:hypothetical protein
VCGGCVGGGEGDGEEDHVDTPSESTRTAAICL